MPLPTILALIILPAAALLERQGLFSPRWKSVAARLLIQLCYPALILATLPYSLRAGEWRDLWILPVATALLLLAGRWVGRRLLPYSGLTDDGKRRSFVFAAILPNYSYVPLLIAQSLWGERGMALVVLSSVGADLILWTLALSTLSQREGFAWRRLLNPPLVSLGFSLYLLSPLGTDWLAWLSPLVPALKTIGAATIPVSMLLLGSHLAQSQRGAGDGRAHLLLLVWRLLVAPALMLAFLLSLPLPPPAGLVLLTIASMPGAIVSVVLAEYYKASPELAARHVFLGHVLAVVSSSFWIYLGMQML